MSQKVKYCGEEVAVLPEVADFLEQERKRSASQGRSDRRHLVFGDWDIPAQGWDYIDCVFETVWHRMRYQKLCQVVAALTPEEQELLYLYFGEELTMQCIGERYGVSRAAISKRLQKLLHRMRGLMET